MRFRSHLVVPALLAVLATPAGALAQDDEKIELEEEGEGEGDDAPAGEEAGGEGDEATAEGEEKKEGEGEEAPEADAAPSDASLVEEAGKNYYFVGARYRAIIVPKFMINIFADGGATAVVHAFGPEFAIRKDNFETNLGMWLAFYSQDYTAYKGGSDPVEAWELVKSELKVLFLTSDFLWSHPFNERFALNYGVGAGIGIVFGNLFRSQSYPGPGSDFDDPNTWDRCAGEFVPDPRFCDDENDHYGDFEESSWFSGGSKPVLFPWLALQTGLRYKASPRFVGRLDLGFALTSGFFFGIGADYGL